MTKLHELFELGGQSPWIDDLKRSYLTAGGLSELIEAGIRGMTSNPTIMAKSIQAGTDYDQAFAELIGAGSSVQDAYWSLVVEDVNGALALLRPLYDASEGGDGFVSLEVAPMVAHDTKATIAMAKSLHARIEQPNLFVKIPATKEGVPAIEEMIAAGRSINVTLIFSLDRYEAVIDAYLSGLERYVSTGGDPSSVASVASFFVSRVDTEVDKRLEAIAQANVGSPRAKRALELRGKAAIAQAKLAYELFERRFAEPRFVALKAANVQRPLWASTSTKNPAYPDLYYVEHLIGPRSVDTMPDATVEAFLDHGKVEARIGEDLGQARADIAALEELGVELHQVTDQLEQEGVASFASSFDELLEALGQKASALSARR